MWPLTSSQFSKTAFARDLGQVGKCDYGLAVGCYGGGIVSIFLGMIMKL